jgi:hypothetical protein
MKQAKEVILTFPCLKNQQAQNNEPVTAECGVLLAEAGQQRAEL